MKVIASNCVKEKFWEFEKKLREIKDGCEIEDNYKRLCDIERVLTFFKAV